MTRVMPLSPATPTSLHGGNRGARSAVCPCGCGAATAHPIAERQTADGIRVIGWSNGDVMLGWEFVAHGVALDDLRVLLSVVPHHGWEELPALVVKARCGRLTNKSQS